MEWICMITLAWTAMSLFWIMSLRSETKTLRTRIEDLTRSPAKGNGGDDDAPAGERRPGPLKLTSLGRDIRDHMDALTWAREAAEPLLVEARNRRPFEIERMAGRYLTERGLDLPDPENLPDQRYRNLHDRISETAYAFGLERKAVINTLRVILRDELLQPGPSPEKEVATP